MESANSDQGPYGRWITDTNKVLALRSRDWAAFWQCDDHGSVEEALDAVQQLLGCLPGMDRSARPAITPDVVRATARVFKQLTSDGGDLWRFMEIAKMPDCMLQDLADLLMRIRDSGIPPMQM